MKKCAEVLMKIWRHLEESFKKLWRKFEKKFWTMFTKFERILCAEVTEEISKNLKKNWECTSDNLRNI